MYVCGTYLSLTAVTHDDFGAHGVGRSATGFASRLQSSLRMLATKWPCWMVCSVYQRMVRRSWWAMPCGPGCTSTMDLRDHTL